MSEFLRRAVVGMIAALLPSPERDRLTEREGIPVAPFSFALGLVQLVVGLYLFATGGIAYMRGNFSIMAMVLLENWQPDLTNTDFAGAGITNWLAWFLHPAAWLFGFVALTGLLRIVAFLATREPVAEPLVWAVVGAWRTTRRRALESRERRELGPPRPDRLERETDGRIVLLTCRPIERLNESVTVEIEGSQYRLVGVEQREDGVWKVMAYTLRPQRENEIVRRLLRYEPGRSADVVT